MYSGLRHSFARKEKEARSSLLPRYPGVIASGMGRVWRSVKKGVDQRDLGDYLERER
jgi:hypothetical protein